MKITIKLTVPFKVKVFLGLQASFTSKSGLIIQEERQLSIESIEAADFLKKDKKGDWAGWYVYDIQTCSV